MLFDGRTARSQATYKGVKAENLMDVVEPENFIVCVLHNQMGLVNKSLEHLLLLAEKDIEKLPEGHAETRKNLLETEKAFQNMKDEMESFVNTGQLRLNASKNQAKASLTNEEREEIDGLKAESERLDKQVEKAKKGNYKEMRKARGKTDDSFSYSTDENIKKVGAKVQAWHGGDLNGVSARLLMENSDKFFGYVENDLIAVRHDDSDFTNQDITEMMMKHYKLIYTELGSCYSYLHQILTSDDDLINLEKSMRMHANFGWKS